MAYDPPDVDTDEDAVAERILGNLVDNLDGFVPVEGDPLVALAEELGRENADTNLLTTTALATAWAGVGETVYQVAPIEATYATLPDVELTFTPVAPGPAGLAASTVPAGFTIVVDDGGDGVAYQLLADVTPTSTDPIHVSMQAVEPGTQGNLAILPEAPPDAQIITSSLAVSSATVLASAAGGLDAETLTAYLERLTDYVSLLRPGGVTGNDLAALARTVPGVHRAVGIDLYDATAGTYGHERTATVVAIDTLGYPFSSDELQAVLEAAREVNFVIYQGEPTFTPVTIEVQVHARPDADADDVHAQVVAAVTAYISPAVWGSTDYAPSSWTERTTLRIFDVISAILTVPGVALIDSVAINGGTEDVTLAGPAALITGVDADTDPSTVTVTVGTIPSA